MLLFTCLVTRALHLKVIRDLLCNTFLLVFHRFYNKKTFTSLMLSGNATTFVAAADHLRELSDSTQIKEHMSVIKCK